MDPVDVEPDDTRAFGEHLLDVLARDRPTDRTGLPERNVGPIAASLRTLGAELPQVERAGTGHGQAARPQNRSHACRAVAS